MSDGDASFHLVQLYSIMLLPRQMENEFESAEANCFSLFICILIPSFQEVIVLGLALAEFSSREFHLLDWQAFHIAKHIPGHCIRTKSRNFLLFTLQIQRLICMYVLCSVMRFCNNEAGTTPPLHLPQKAMLV